MPAPTIDQFLGDFPEFENNDKFPDSTIRFWLETADLMLTGRWDDTIVSVPGSPRTMRYVGIGLFTAHNVAIQARNIKASANPTGAPGIASSTGVGVVAAKAVDETSVSYDTQASVSPNAGHWNLTTYGTQFIRMARMVGAGGLQTGVHHNLNFMVPVPQGPAWWGVSVDLGFGWD